MEEIYMGEIKPFDYKIGDLDRVIDEKGSTFMALRKIAWGVGQNEEVDDSKFKLDLRKYYTTPDGEKMNKGVSFLTDEGPDELIKVLLEEGYGNTGECLAILKDREDWVEAVTFAYDLEPSEDNDEFYDPRKLLELSV